MKVAVPWCQHSSISPGQCASSQTVFNFKVAHDPLQPEIVLTPGAPDFQPVRLGFRGA